MTDNRDNDPMNTIAEQLSELVRREVDALKQDLRQGVRSAGRGTVLVAGSGILGIYAGAAAVTGVTLVLARRFPPWRAAMVTGAALAAAAGSIAVKGMAKLREAPRTGTESLQNMTEAMGDEAVQ